MSQKIYIALTLNTFFFKIDEKGVDTRRATCYYINTETEAT